MYKVKVDDVEGKTYINVNDFSKTELGKELGIGYIFDKVMTPIGYITSIRNAMEYITVPNYPREYLIKTKKLNKHEVSKVSTNGNLNLPNYTATLALITYYRIKNDSELISKLRELNNPNIKFTSYYDKEYVNDGVTTVIRSYVYKNSRYVDIVRDAYLSIVYKKYTLKEFMDKYTYRKDLELFHGAAIEVKVDIQE